MKHQAFKCTLLCLVTILYTLTVSGVTMGDPLADLKKVGEAKLQVLFWDVYNSSLYSKTGEYETEIFPQALKINYLRDIDAKDLIDRTQDEWKKLGIEKVKFSPWILLLTDILPDIKKGDTLLLNVNKNQQSEFFFNGKTIGKITDQAFGKSFLRIWLDENCSYPKVRNKLIGLHK
jgi:hypothetical protein